MKELIMQRLKELNIDKNGIWHFAQWNKMKWEFTSAAREEFVKCTEELVENGFFEALYNGVEAYDYKLTEKGYKALYGWDVD